MNNQGFLKAFNELFPNCKYSEKLVSCFAREFKRHNINTLNRVAMFVAQCGHESNGFTEFTENLNYSADALTRVFPKYFKDRDVEQYARNPKKIASLVYANRMGNGNEASCDGWKYRGRGIIQITGKQNYIMLSKYCGIDFVENPDILCVNIDYAVKSALWFWVTNNLNKLCDNLDIKAITKRINGGYNGLAERENLYRLCLEKFRKVF